MTQFLVWFNATAIQQNPALANVFIPFGTLNGVNNAIATAGFVAWNPLWFQSVGDIPATAIFAHELGHIAQIYQLVPAVPPVGTLVEDQADYISAYMLKASGTFSQQDASTYIAFANQFPNGDATHSPGPVRGQIFAQGFAAAP